MGDRGGAVLVSVRNLFLASLLLLPITAEAAATFFWRAEGTTLDSTHDFSAGDTTATANGGVSITGTAAKVGSNGILTTNASDWYEFSPTSIATTGQGVIGGWIQFKTAVPGTNQGGPIALRNSANSSDVIAIGYDTNGGNNDLRGFLQRNGGSSLTLTTTACGFVADTWYFVVFRWNISADDRKIECYDSSGNLIDSAEDLSTDLSNVEPTAIDEMRVGNPATNANPIWVDNVFVSQTYAEPIENFKSITSYQSAYTSGPTAGTFTTTTEPFTYTPNQNGTTYAAACTNGQTISTGANVESGTCSGGAAVGTGNDASVAGVGDTVTITGLSAGTTYDVYIVHKSSIGGYSAVSSLADQTTASAGFCGFDSGPTVSSQTASAYTISYDATAQCDTLYCMAKLKDASLPSASDVESGTGAHGTANEATTGSADTMTLTPSDSDKLPVYDLYCVLKDNPSTLTLVSSLLDEYLDAPSGRQYLIKSGDPTGSQEGLLDDASPAAVDGDVIDVSTLTTSFANGADAHVLTLNADTTYEVDIEHDDVGAPVERDLSRQTVTRRFYDVSAAAWSDASPVLYCIRNVAPVFVYPDAPNGVPFLFEKGATLNIVLDNVWDDAESDSLTHAASNIPAGGSLTGSETITGAFTTFGYYDTVDLTATDACGDQSEQTVEIVVGLRLPDVTSWLLDESLWKNRSIFTGAVANSTEYETFLPRAANH